MGKPLAQIEAETTPQAFEATLWALYQQYMAGAFSFGRFTELAGVAQLELREVLDAMGLAVTK